MPLSFEIKLNRIRKIDLVRSYIKANMAYDESKFRDVSIL